MNRRQYVATAIVTITTGTLAGCSGGSGGGGSGDSSNGSGGGGGGGNSNDGGGTATSGGGGSATTGGAGQMTGTSESGTATTGGTTTGGQSTTGGETTTGTGGKAAVGVVSNDKYGEILVGPDGRSLYLFEKDEKGTSTCQGACAKAWPPLTVTGSPTKGNGVTAAIGTISRADGSTQLTAAGHPLYYYAPDKKPGDTKGQELEQFGAEWYLLAPDGSKVEGEGGEEGGESTTTGGSGSGSGY